MTEEVWMNKKTAQLFIVKPYWEILKIDEMIDSKFVKEVTGVTAKMGTLTQEGWLLVNEHGVRFVCNMNLQDQCVNLGELGE